MSNIFTPKLNILPEAQQKLWSELSPSIDLGMVLYGGTAVALQLGHRFSIDFDFFQHKPLDREAIFSAFSFALKSEIIQDQPNAITLEVPSGINGKPVKVSFFGGIDFGRISSPMITDDSILRVASLDDLMATKLKVLFDRVAVKDYQDIAAMISNGVSLERGLSGAQLLFGNKFQPAECLKILVYFEGGDLAELSEDQKDVLFKAAKIINKLPIIIKDANDISAVLKSA